MPIVPTSEVTTAGGDTSHDGGWGAKPHSRTRRDYSYILYYVLVGEIALRCCAPARIDVFLI